MCYVKGNPDCWMAEIERVEDEIARLAGLMRIPLPGLCLHELPGTGASAYRSLPGNLARLIALHFRIVQRAIDDIGAERTQVVLDYLKINQWMKHGDGTSAH